MKKNDEFDRFDAGMRELIKVPHSVIKARLDAEKKAKGRKPKKASGHRASGAKRHGSA